MGIFGKIGGFFKGVGRGVSRAVKKVGDVAKDVGKKVGSVATDVAKKVGSFVTDPEKMKKVAGVIGDVAQKAIDVGLGEVPVLGQGLRLLTKTKDIGEIAEKFATQDIKGGLTQLGKVGAEVGKDVAEAKLKKRMGGRMTR